MCILQTLLESQATACAAKRGAGEEKSRNVSFAIRGLWGWESEGTGTVTRGVHGECYPAGTLRTAGGAVAGSGWKLGLRAGWPGRGLARMERLAAWLPVWRTFKRSSGHMRGYVAPPPIGREETDAGGDERRGLYKTLGALFLSQVNEVLRRGRELELEGTDWVCRKKRTIAVPLRAGEGLNGILLPNRVSLIPSFRQITGTKGLGTSPRLGLSAQVGVSVSSKDFKFLKPSEEFKISSVGSCTCREAEGPS
ncbi:hypothetical protein R1flu_027774 [Riccia fluitans]|uniref:Uncharacterized protein n=1 Tax=Riccia fluitans TaxID=41844 RepID=A0ABD1XJV6_9MARC